MISVNLTRSWIRTGAICGLLAIVAYLVSSVLPTFLPRIIDYYLFFAIGVLGIVFVAGLYKLLSHHSRESVPLQIGALFGIIAGVLQNAMAVVQATTSIFISRYIREAPDEVTKETFKLIWKGVNLVQLGLDVSWDIFLLIGLILIGVAMLHHPRFGKAFGWTGIFLAGLTLGLNLYTFPEPPGEALGPLFDLGPLVGIWLLAVVIQMFRSIPWLDTVSHQKGLDKEAV